MTRPAAMASKSSTLTIITTSEILPNITYNIRRKVWLLGCGISPAIAANVIKPDWIPRPPLLLKHQPPGFPLGEHCHLNLISKGIEMPRQLIEQLAVKFATVDMVGGGLIGGLF